MTAPVQQDLKFFHCQERSSLPTNGGRLSTTEIIDKVMNNVWPHVLRAEREAGGRLRRKLALKVHQDGDGKLATAEFCFDGPTLGEDRCVLFAGTPRDTEADITDVNGDLLSGTSIYCSGVLAQPITAGSKTVVVNIKDAADAAGVQPGRSFRLTDKLVPESTSGNVEYHEIDDKSVSGTQITITTVDPIANNYAAYDTEAHTGGKLGVIMAHSGEVIASASAMDITSTAGDYDDDTYPITFNNQGADEQDITITFTDATSFTVSSDRFGALASGSRNSDYTALHPTWNKAMFTIDADGWSGTFAGGDTVEFTTHACAVYWWEERNVPENCGPLSSNRIILCNRSEGL